LLKIQSLKKQNHKINIPNPFIFRQGKSVLKFVESALSEGSEIALNQRRLMHPGYERYISITARSLRKSSKRQRKGVNLFSGIS